jgi:hypothetical protein
MAISDRYNSNINGLTFRERTKQARQKRLFNTLKRLYLVVGVWALVIAYLVSPYSKARINAINGVTTILNENDIYQIANFNPNNFWWAIDQREIEQRLNNYKYIENANLRVTPLGLEIDINEISVVAKYGSQCLNYGDNCIFILSNSNEVIGLDNFASIDVKHIASFGNIALIKQPNDFSNEQRAVLYLLLGRVSKDIRNGLLTIAKSPITTTTVIDLILSGSYFNLNHDLKLVIDLGSLDAKLTRPNIDFIIGSIRANNPSLVEGRYCYIYRAADYALPCE